MPTATANFAMNTKSLILLFAGMTLSFGIILAIMVAAVTPDSKPPSRRRAPQNRSQYEKPAVTRTSKSQVPARKARATRRPQSTAATSTTEQAPTPTLESETLPPPAITTRAPIPQQQTPITPNQASMQQLGTLKKELGRELQALKKDRDAMLKALAQSLIALPPKEIALELSALDDQSTTTLLRQFTPEMRNKVLSHVEAKRAKRLKSRFK